MGGADGHVCALLALAHLGHRGNTGGGQSPAPMVLPIQNYSDVAVQTQIIQAHSTVKEGGRVEATEFGTGGGKGGNLKGIQRLWS